MKPISIVLVVLVILAALLLGIPAAVASESATGTAAKHFDIYKSPTCSCCGRWITHVEKSGYKTTVHHPTDLARVKASLNIPNRYQSCHTAVTEEGFVFEGHIPANIIDRFIAQPPKDAIGLTVPGMPVGSPGMEVGDKFMPYDVLLLKKDGTTQVYASVTTLESQY